MSAIVLFWASIALVGWAYAGYPALVAALAAVRGRTPRIDGDPSAPDASTTSAPTLSEPIPTVPTLTVVIAAHDEAARIAARVRDVLAQDYPRDALRVIVVDDGSRDATAAAAAEIAANDPRVRVIALPDNRGKACAVNAGVAQATGAIVAFTDARQRYAPGALRALVAAFADPQVGAVSGELVIAGDDDGDGSDGVGLYWRMERRLRSDEARLGWLHGVSGANYAVRRALYPPIPAGTILDDMWVPLRVLMGGARVWHSRDAIAHDRPSSASGEEFRRKLRTLSGNWQLMARLPRLLTPWTNPVFFAWCSHKLLRLLAPWALLIALVASGFAPGAFYRTAFVVQLIGYACAAAALWRPRLGARVPLLPAAAAFVMLNAAALLALPASLAFAPSKLWKKH